MSTTHSIPAKLNCTLTVTAVAGDKPIQIVGILAGGALSIDGVDADPPTAIIPYISIFSPITCTTFTASSVGSSDLLWRSKSCSLSNNHDHHDFYHFHNLYHFDDLYHHDHN